MEHGKTYWTGNYAVVHFGTKESPSNLPCYLIGEGKGDTKKFTNNILRAALFNTRLSAEMAMEKEDEHLGEMKHPLKGRLSVVGVYLMKEGKPND